MPTKTTDLRERIIATASKLFYQNGYSNTGINEVIAKAGIAKASLYSHFKSKEDLCIAYLQAKDGQFMSALRDHLAQQEAGKARVLALFDFLVQFYHSEGFRGCWCLNTLSELPQDNVRIRVEVVLQKGQFRRYILQVVAQELPGTNHEQLANRIYLLYEGAITEAYLHQEPWPIMAAKELVDELI